ncbi:MAG: DUF2508 family protein [Peptococcaceae bacterium]|nr:DUF2508 family protein [Peptococcaceae bacterium]MBO5115114.1 DUF2508 family protein [Peptococcaceae bacterium]MBO5301099.1 DUF2508 family protein [Peptococcaceae bacterium]MBO5366430.1 DUF2508 family protein [Peptococcaceae bacterium]MBO5429885.1 DUF2508 family protein [Peptococcaceae bacterium]
MDLQTALQEARTQWRNLESIYNQVTDPAVIDSIIHQMIVAEQTYDRLLSRARAENITTQEIQMR